MSREECARQQRDMDEFQARLEAAKPQMVEFLNGLGQPNPAAVAARPAGQDEHCCDATAAVERCRKLIAFYDRHEYSSLEVDDLRRALDGDE